LISILGGVFFLIGGFAGEYGVQGTIGTVLVAVVVGVFLGVGLIVGGLYGMFWAFEELEWIEDNPIDSFYHVYLVSWYESLSTVDWIRIPLIYLEYHVTLMRDQTEFDATNEEFQALFLFLAYPFVWNLVLILNPFLFLFMPIIMIVYWSDPSLFE
jgi:hypothetical protein